MLVTLTWSALLVYALLTILRIIMRREKKPRIEGICHENYEGVRESFSANFKDGWEAEGAAFAVYKDGELIIDLWGGYANKKQNRPWREDTLTTVFSTTKSIAAMCFAMLVERGQCFYHDRVSSFWPEFAKNGKENITIEQVLGHQAGMPYLDQVLDHDDIHNEEIMDTIIEQQTPKLYPGSKTAYHPITFGWLCDGIFRRIDPQKRSIGKFYKEEIQEKHNIDLYIGDCQSEEYRMATMKLYSKMQIIRECGYDLQVAKTGLYYHNPKSYFYKSMVNMKNFGKNFTMYNNPELRLSGQPACNGVGTARGLAKVHLVLAEGHLVGKEMMELIQTPQFPDTFDYSLRERCHKGRGWMYFKTPTGGWIFGHSGVGGQNVRVDMENGLVYAYVCNGFKAGTGNHCFTFNRLERKLLDCFEKEKKENVKFFLDKK